MAHRGYIGEKRGERAHWYVPERWRDAWRRDGHRLVREVRESDGEFDEPRPVVLARARKVQVSVTESQDPVTETTQPKRGRRGVRAGT